MLFRRNGCRVRMAIRRRDLPGATARPAESPSGFAPSRVRKLTRTVGAGTPSGRDALYCLVPIEHSAESARPGTATLYRLLQHRRGSSHMCLRGPGDHGSAKHARR